MDNDAYDFHSPVFKGEMIFLKGIFFRMFWSIKSYKLCEAIELKFF